MPAGWSSTRVLRNDDLIEELRRRLKITDEFLCRLCSFSTPTKVWYLLYSQGPMRFSELVKAGFSRSWLRVALRRLEAVGLVRRVNYRYVAVAPEEIC